MRIGWICTGCLVCTGFLAFKWGVHYKGIFYSRRHSIAAIHQRTEGLTHLERRTIYRLIPLRFRRRDTAIGVRFAFRFEVGGPGGAGAFAFRVGHYKLPQVRYQVHFYARLGLVRFANRIRGKFGVTFRVVRVGNLFYRIPILFMAIATGRANWRRVLAGTRQYLDV